MASMSEIARQLFHPYYFFNILFSTCFMICKTYEPLCNIVFSKETPCELSSRDLEVLLFLVVIVMYKSRKTGARSLFSYISTASMYAKICNVYLWLNIDPIKGLIYIIAITVHFLIVGEPVYRGPENVIYFDGSGIEEELQKKPNGYWLIVFYATWNSNCTSLAPVFSKLSLEFSLPNLQFGKLDVGKYPTLAKKYHINDTAFSLQLPTIALYKGDKELMRRPHLDSKGKYQKFYFTEDNIRAAYDLNNVYLECTKACKNQNLLKSEREKAD